MNSPFKLSLISLAILAPTASAEEIPLYRLDDVMVTATRFHETDRTTPSNVTTLTREDILRTPASNIPDLLATRAGIDVRSLYGGQGVDATVSLRGFGENANLRTLILVDGRRLDSLEFVSPNWSSIPMGSIERIEIVRGSGAVLYGDQAVAGVINIITNRGQKNASDVAVEFGSFNAKSLSASLSRNDTPLRFSLTANHKESDEYRRNNAHRSTSGSARVARDVAAGEVYAEMGISELRYGLPGTVTAAQWNNNDLRASETTDSWFKRENQYLRPGARWQIAPNLEAAAELNVEQSHNRSWVSNWASYRDVQVGTLGFSPRLRWSHGLGNLSSVTVAGLDWSDARLDQNRAASPQGAITKRVALDRDGSGVYVQNTTQPTEQITLTAGARQQRFNTRTTDSTVADPLISKFSKTATDLGAVWQPAAAWKLFAKTNSTFRYPVLDELTTWGGLAALPVRPESGRGVDVGGEWRIGKHSVQVTHYDLKMNDEISWNNNTQQNENLQRTRHRGTEIDSHWALATNWRLDLSWNGKTATLSEGVNTGKTIPLVPGARASALLGWDGGTTGNHALLANHVGARYFGGDDANVQAKMPAYTTLDWQSRWRVKEWELAARVANLSNRKYASFGSDYGYGASYYPANPRAVNLTARVNF